MSSVEPLVGDFLRASPDALFLVDEDGVIVHVTEAVVNVFGYEPEEVIGQKVEMLLPAGVRKGHVAHRKGYMSAPEVRPMGIGLDLTAVKKDGSVFPVDVSLVPPPRPGVKLVGAFVRDATERRRDEALLRAVNEISRITLEGWSTNGLLQLVASRARSLLGAAGAWVAVMAEGQSEMVVAAADGIVADLVGSTVPAETSIAAKAITEDRTVLIDDMSTDEKVLEEARSLDLGAGLYLPMRAEDGPVGALVVARLHGSDRFSPAETNAAEIFASAAAIVVALGSARLALEDSRLVSEHERIARDLHDTVIQRLFAVGMGLQAAERMPPEKVAERVRATVDQLDEVIREIRETIFDLNRQPGSGPDLRQEVRSIVDEAHLGFRPRVAFRGPVDIAVPASVRPHLLSVLREALSNVSRHAKSRQVDVVVVAGESDITLNVSDDGIGVDGVPSAGHGLGNMASRARELGGELTISRRRPQGTLIQWRVPRRAE